MTPAQIASIREALPKAQRYLRDVEQHPAFRETPGGRGLVRCQPIVEAMPAVLDELERLRWLYDECVQSHQKMNGDYERATDVLEAVANEQPEVAGNWEALEEIAYRMRSAARAFMESE